jgi:hypothetical protein
MEEVHAIRGSEPLPLSAALILGIIAAPGIFAWLVLRRGYSRDVRIGAFLLLALGLATQLGHL